MELSFHGEIRAAEVRALMVQLQAPRLNRALSVAVNTSARQVAAKAASNIAKEMSLPVKRAKLGIWVRPYSTPQTLTAIVRASNSPIPLKAFEAKDTPKDVRAKIWGKRTVFPGRFILGGTFPNRKDIGMGGHVFVRRGKKRLPLDKEPGASIAEGFVRDRISDTLVSHSQERIIHNVLRQLDRAISARKKP